MVRGFSHPNSPARILPPEFSRLILPPISPALGVKGRGGAARSRLVDARREAVGVRARPPSRGFSKRLEGRRSREWGGAMGGAPRCEGRSPGLERADRMQGSPLFSLWSMVSSSPPVSRWFMLPFALVSLSPCGSCSSDLPVVHDSLRLSLVVRCSCFLWFSAPKVVQLFLWSGSGGGPVHWRRGREAQQCRLCGGPARLDEGSRKGFAGHTGGPETRRDHADGRGSGTSRLDDH